MTVQFFESNYLSGDLGRISHQFCAILRTQLEAEATLALFLVQCTKCVIRLQSVAFQFVKRGVFGASRLLPTINH